MINILVTGGAGFIGSNFINFMLNKYKEYKFINVDCLTYAGNLDNLKNLVDESRYFFIEGDIRNRKFIKKVFEDYDIRIVVNFAAESHVDRSIVSPQDFITTNVLGTHILLDEAKSYWNLGISTFKFPNDVKFIQISTDEVYGSLDNNGSFKEDSPISPNSPYSASKASADLIVQAYNRTYGLPINITRCSNNYGINQFPEKLIPKIIELANKNYSIPIYGNGLQIRDWIHVIDHCSAIDRVIHIGISGEIYNIGSNFEMRNIDIAHIILEKMNKPLSLISFVKDRLGHDYRYAIDNSKIRRKLGWSPSISFEDGINETIESILAKNHFK